MACLYESDVPSEALNQPSEFDLFGARFVRHGDTKFYLPVGFEDDEAYVSGGVWPNRTVRVQFADDLTQTRRQNIKDACGAWTNATGIHFTEEAVSNEFAYFQASDANNAPVGYHPGRNAVVEIASWGDLARIAHEVGHVLGLQHEHQRLDSTTYFTVNDANLTPLGKANYDPWSGGKTKTEYDFRSVMHYEDQLGDTKFVKDPSQRILIFKDGYKQWAGKVGIHAISKLDAEEIKSFYGIP